MAFTLESTVCELLNDQAAVEVLEKYAPGITRNPLIGFAKGMTLRSLLSAPQALQNGLTEERALNILAEIETLRNSRT